MNYREYFERYKTGSADESEIRAIEGDIEKHRVLSDYLDETMDRELLTGGSVPDNAAGLCGEIPASKKDPGLARMIRRAVNRKLIIFSLIVGAAVLAVVLFLLFGLSPYMDANYYDPAKTEKADHQVINITELPLAVYTELHCAEREFQHADITPEGFGRYNIDMVFEDGGKFRHYYVNMDKGHIVGNGFEWRSNGMTVNEFTRGIEYMYEAYDDSGDIAELKTLPQSAVVTASVSFKKDEDLRAVQDLIGRYSTVYVPVRITAHNDQKMDYYGFVPNGSGLVYEKEMYGAEAYPYLDLAQYYDDNNTHGPVPADACETHFKSMLKYMRDQTAFNEAFNNDLDYSEVLSYVEQNGVKTFGMIVSVPVGELLELRRDARVESMRIRDVKVSRFSR
jgi:hypothetical protein